jgi:hypothetical protein
MSTAAALQAESNYCNDDFPILSFLFAIYCDEDYRQTTVQKWLASNKTYKGYLINYTQNRKATFDQAAITLVHDRVGNNPPDPKDGMYMPTREQADEMVQLYMRRELPSGEAGGSAAPAPPDLAYANAERPIVAALGLLFLNGDSLSLAELQRLGLPPGVPEILSTVKRGPGGRPYLTAEKLEELRPAWVDELTRPKNIW